MVRPPLLQLVIKRNEIRCLSFRRRLVVNKLLFTTAEQYHYSCPCPVFCHRWGHSAEPPSSEWWSKWRKKSRRGSTKYARGGGGGGMRKLCVGDYNPVTRSGQGFGVLGWYKRWEVRWGDDSVHFQISQKSNGSHDWFLTKWQNGIQRGKIVGAELEREIWDGGH